MIGFVCIGARGNALLLDIQPDRAGFAAGVKSTDLSNGMIDHDKLFRKALEGGDE